jgi:hypothetical protein
LDWVDDGREFIGEKDSGIRELVLFSLKQPRHYEEKLKIITKAISVFKGERVDFFRIQQEKLLDEIRVNLRLKNVPDSLVLGMFE